MKNLSILVMMSAILAWMCVACDRYDSAKDGTPYDPSKPVTLINFSPDSGRIAEKMILEGYNFGNDPAKIRVYINKKEAKVIGAFDTYIYAVVPRLPGDTCTVSVVVNNDSVTYPKKFLYQKSVSISTITGTGASSPIIAGSLSQAQFNVNYLCVDKDKNIFVVSQSDGGAVLKVNEEENSVTVVTTNAKSGITGETAPACITNTGVVFITGRWDPRDQNWTLDPKEGWVARSRMSDWSNSAFPPGFPPRVGVAYCELDGHIYIPYWNGDLMKVDPVTMQGFHVRGIQSGDLYGGVFHPKQKHLLFLAYPYDGGDNAHSICVFNTLTNDFYRFAGSGIGGHRDGSLDVARFRSPRQMVFDEDGNLYVADMENYCIRKITTDNKVETVIGIPGVAEFKDGSPEEALLNWPSGLAIDHEGTIYIADQNRLRKLAIE